jgi:poly(3-hydroxybutyrate) depolymerase
MHHALNRLFLRGLPVGCGPFFAFSKAQALARACATAWLCAAFTASTAQSTNVGVPETGTLAVPAGTASFIFRDQRGRPDRPITVHSHRPTACGAHCPILFVMHGNTRNAAGYRDHWVPWADTLGLVILAPEFNRQDWPGSRSYNQGDMAAQANPAMWSYSVIEHLFDAVRTTQTCYRIFGHSAGAQFVHRFLVALPNNRASLALMANAGWYTLPEWREDRASFQWPHSLVGARVGEAGVRAALYKPAVVLLGEADNNPSVSDLDQAAGSRAQGPHRLARGLYYWEQVNAVAHEMGITLPWALVRVPGVGHDAKGMTDAAARFMQSSALER